MENTFTLTITGTEHAEWQGILKQQTVPDQNFKAFWNY